MFATTLIVLVLSSLSFNWRYPMLLSLKTNLLSFLNLAILKTDCLSLRIKSPLPLPCREISSLLGYKPLALGIPSISLPGLVGPSGINDLALSASSSSNLSNWLIKGPTQYPLTIWSLAILFLCVADNTNTPWLILVNFLNT